MKSFVIYKEGDAFSTELASECIDSANKFGITVEKYPGVYSDIENKFIQEKLFVNLDCNGRIDKLGVRGCLLSHLYLWQMCVEADQPLFIFEHDALMINPLPNNVLDLFDDYLNLDYNRKIYRKNLKGYHDELTNLKTKQIDVIKMDIKSGTGFKFINRNHIVGAHGYIIKPEGARKIIAGILSDGAIPADMAPNSKYVNMHHTTQTVVRVNPKMTIDMAKLSHTRN
jgi:GR25 family glycosyltransferase involved in LPS biosynthesis